MTSLTQRIIDDIAEQIRSGKLRPGDRLPSGRAMRAHYGVSAMPVRMAIERLRAQGLIYTVHGLGSFVADQTDNPDPPDD